MALNYEPAGKRRDALRFPLAIGEYNKKFDSSPAAYSQGILQTEAPDGVYLVDFSGQVLASELIASAKIVYIGISPNTVSDLSGSPWSMLLRGPSGLSLAFAKPVPCLDFLTGAISSDVLMLREDIEPVGGRTSVLICEQDVNSATTAFEQWYDLLSKWAVTRGSREVRDRLIAIWKTSGERGAYWLTRRLLIEKQIDVQEAALEALVEIGQPAVPYVIGSLAQFSRRDDNEHLILLLRALRWLRQADLGTKLEMVPRLIQRFFQSSDGELREAAYRCTEILPTKQAVELLTIARSSEPDSELQRVIDELLEEADHR